PLRLNGGLGQLEGWNEEEIQARGERLATKAAQVWQFPFLDADALDTYRPIDTPNIAYTIDDHPYLLSGESRRLFEAFRREVIALDSCVSEEFLKYYVAYKAETNFVDVYPQATRLRLILNLPFDEVVDPLGRCSSVAGYR